MPKNRKPKNDKLRTEWDFSLLYARDNDPQIERDIVAFEKAVDDFEARYRTDAARLAEPAFLRQAIEDYERLIAMPEGGRGGFYYGLRREIDAADTRAEKQLNLLSDRLTKAGNKLLFFELTLGKFDTDLQQRLLASPDLAEFRYYLSRIFLEAAHNLTEAEERIMNLKSLTSRSLWVAGTDKIFNKRTVRFKGKDIPIAEAFEKVAQEPKASRRKLWNACMQACKETAEIAENEMNAVVLDKKIGDELRGYAKPYSATVMGYENDEQSIETLVETVTKHFPIAHRFYRLKAKLMREPHLLYPDRSAKIGTDRKITFEQSVDVLRRTFYALKDEYGQILDQMLARGQIDAFPKKGKTGGAFCAGDENLPTFVLLNYVPSMRALSTFAHEMGHAIHTERAKEQRPLYQGYSTATAETASTFFENVVFDAELALLSDREKIVALHDKINDEIASIMRQVAFFNFERDLHERIRAEGALTKEELAALFRQHLGAYLGPKVKVTEDDGYGFVYISHFRNFFYVYTYAYGNVISNFLAKRLREDPAFIEEIDRFLTAGSSKSPEDIFKDIGIDTTKPAFFAEGMQMLDERITELEKLVKKR